MDIDSVGRSGDPVVSPIAPPPQPAEPKEEAAAPAPEAPADSGKTLDLYA